MTGTFDKSAKIQLLSHGALIAIFIIFLTSSIIPGINANSNEIKINTQKIEEIKLTMAEFNIEELDNKLSTIDTKLGKIILGMCGEFGGKYCE